MTTTPLDLSTIHLAAGGHASPEKGACLLEAVSWFAGEPWSDRPACTSPLLAAAGRSLNDAITDQAERDALKDLIPHLVDTAGDGLDAERSAIAWAFYVNRWVPAWMDLPPSLAVHVTALPQVDTTDKAETKRVLDAARSAADAAGDAAWDAAGAAAWAAAWDAAGDAAGAAAGAAARAALRETSDRLRAEFTDVYRQMVLLGKDVTVEPS